MKVLALDVGDVWTGTALSDSLKMFAQPHQTVKSPELENFLANLFKNESIETVVIGHPKTMSGTASAQTTKVENYKVELEQKFPDLTWILWDERLTSKQAATIKKAKNKQEKLKRHSVAAALILETYLNYLQMHNNS